MNELETLKQLEESVISIRVKVKSVLDMLDLELIPNSEQIDELAASLKKARDTHKSLTKKLSITPGNKPNDDMSLKTIKEAVEKLADETDKKRIKHARRIFDEFQQLHTDVERYEVELDKHKKKLANYSDEEIKQLSEDKIVLYEVFLRAVKDVISDAEFENLLVPAFGDTLALAVNMKKISILPTGKIKDSIKDTANDESKKPSRTKQLPVTNPDKDIDEQVDDNISAEKEYTSIDLLKYGIELVDDSEYGKLKKYTSNKTPKGVKAFLSDMDKKPIGLKASLTVLLPRMLSQRAIFADEYLAVLNESEGTLKDFHDDAVIALSYLEKEGYVAYCNIPPKHTNRLFYFTSGGIKVLKSDSLKHFWSEPLKHVSKVHDIYSAADYMRMLYEQKLFYDYNDSNYVDKCYKVEVVGVEELIFIKLEDDEIAKLIFIPCIFSSNEKSQLDTLFAVVRIECDSDTKIVIYAPDENQIESWVSVFRDVLSDVIPEDNVIAADIARNAFDMLDIDILDDDGYGSGDIEEIDDENDSNNSADTALVDEFNVEASSDSFTIAQKMLDEGITPVDKNRFDALISSLLSEAANNSDDTDFIGRAIVMAKTLALADKENYDSDYRRLLLATDLPIDDRIYSHQVLSTYFDNNNKGTALHLAALLRTLFRPSSQFDYGLSDYVNNLFDKYDEVFSLYPEVKSMLDIFRQIGTVSREGFTDAIISRFMDDRVKNEIIKNIKSAAADLYKVPHINQRFNGALEMLEECFGSKSDFGLCMDLISKNKEDDRELVIDVYEIFTDNDKVMPQKVDDFIDEKWKIVRQNIKKKIINNDIISVARTKVESCIHQRLELMNRWLAYTNTPTNINENSVIQATFTKTLGNLKETRKELLNVSATRQDTAILMYAIDNMLSRLTGSKQALFKHDDWLSTGIFCISDGIPIIDESRSNIQCYEHWRNALRHISSKPKKNLIDALDEICDPENPLYDNLGQAISICEHLGTDSAKYESSGKYATEKANKDILDFTEKITLDYAYGRVEEQMKEVILGELSQVELEFFERQDFGELRFLLKALRGRIDTFIIQKKKELEENIQERQRNGKSKLQNTFLEQASAHLDSENANFILVEENINLYDCNADPGYNDFDVSEDDPFSTFISYDNYSRLERICKDNRTSTLKTFAGDFIRKELKNEKQRESVKGLLTSLPNSAWEASGSGIKVLLSELGFNVQTADKVNTKEKNTYAIFSVKVKPDTSNKEIYKHPIADMGTKMGNELQVVELFGSMEPNAIISAVQAVKLKKMSIVFLNNFLTLAQRRQLAKLFLKDGTAQTPFLLIDWIMLLHLALQAKEDRIHIMLACTMPYTGCKQLFSANSVMPVADEMFIGRVEEIRKIQDMNGPVIVYGGRQLGKTAVLLRATNLFHNPERKDYGVYADVKECHDEKAFVSALVEKLRGAGINLNNVTTIKAMCGALRTWLKSSDRNLLLLIDESDKILSKLAENNYAALNGFEQLSRETGSFKFVFAGLHNVFSAAKDANTIFGHFGKPICIYPLSHSDAYRLLARPLRYLGFSAGSEELLPLLVNTNFYPGVVHYIGTRLIDMLSHYYPRYYNEKSNPPYQLGDKQIGSLMHSNDLAGMIGDLIKKTLEADIVYSMLARCIATLYYEDKQSQNRGYSAQTIIEEANQLGIVALQEITVEQCDNLLSEMCDMSLLVKDISSDRYRFRQSRILTLVGKDADDILEQIVSDQEVE